MSNNYTPKYQVYTRVPDYPGKRGRKPTEIDWQSDRRYGYLKHRAQARFRGEAYALTLEDWETLWTETTWHQRGRGKTDVTLYRIRADEPWCVDNVVIVEQQHKGKYYQADRTPGGRPRKQ